MSEAIKRKPLNRPDFAFVMLRQEGKCGCRELLEFHPAYADFPVCGKKLDAREGIVDEHLNPLAAGGGNELSNRALLRKPCAKIKTDEYDARIIAKVTHMGGGRGSQQARRERAAEKGLSPSISSRGFQTNKDGPYKAKFGGGVVRRDAE